MNTGANAPQDQITLKEEKRGGGTQAGGRSSKENKERKTTYGQPDKPNSGIQPSDNTEPGIFVDYLPLLLVTVLLNMF